MVRTDTIPPGEPDNLTEDNLARAIYEALQREENLLQEHIVSRILTAHEIAQARLREPDIQDPNTRTTITLDEIREVVRKTPSPPPEDFVARDRLLGTCVACDDPGPAIRLRCHCTYCLPCYRQRLRLQLAQPGTWPPRCCGQAINEEVILRAGRPALLHLSRQRELEATTPVGERVFCHDGRCAAIIPLFLKGRCLACQQITCVRCGGPQHPANYRCDGGEVVEDAWETMDRNGAVNCPNCAWLISIGDGCNHMM